MKPLSTVHVPSLFNSHTSHQIVSVSVLRKLKLLKMFQQSQQQHLNIKQLNRACGCKGIRSCLICEAEFGIHKAPDNDNFVSYEYCYLCDGAWTNVSKENVSEQHPNHSGDFVEFPGVLLIPDFLTIEEEDKLIDGCDKMPWDLSQSGRRKQNFGPKTNFKKMKINGKSFEGFPKFSEFAQIKLNETSLLKDFQTIEQCAIEYRPETGASIDPHIDDCWVWGERVISLSLISDSVLTMTKYSGGVDKYNLRYHYDSINDIDDHLNESDSVKNCEFTKCSKDYPIVRIPMPARSLLVLYGPARYEWEHCILRNDIKDRRICMAYREFTPEFLKGGKSYENIGQDVINKAMNFS